MWEEGAGKDNVKDTLNYLSLKLQLSFSPQPSAEAAGDGAGLCCSAQ